MLTTTVVLGMCQVNARRILCVLIDQLVSSYLMWCRLTRRIVYYAVCLSTVERERLPL